MSTTDLPCLAELNPEEAWKPWRPTLQDPWNLKWVGHLFRRAGVGAPPHVPGASAWQGYQRAVQQGLQATLDELFEFGKEETEYDRIMDGLAPGQAGYQPLDGRGDAVLLELQTWWLQRLAFTPHPLRERMTLFWHTHFATSIAKVRNAALMVKQNQMLRQHGLGRFGPLVLAVSRDPAMLVWLDSNTNSKGQPNENFARELLELFTLGPGHYTEQDVREAARAFTGWHLSGRELGGPGRPVFDSSQPGGAPRFVFNSAQHDHGPKVFLGREGAWDGGDIIRLVLEQPAAARFLARKLYRQFISELEPPPDALLEPLAEQLRRSDYDLAAVLRTLLSSRLFFSAHAYRQRIKSPVEFVVGLIRSLDADTVPAGLAVHLEGLGQRLFAPPNVKGWDGGKAWLNSATVLARHNLAWSLVGDTSDRATPSPVFRGNPEANLTPLRLNPAAVAQKHAGKESSDQKVAQKVAQEVASEFAQNVAQLDFLLDLFLQGDVPAAARQKLIDYLAQGPAAAGARARRLREVAHTILLMPEYQLA